eukprot:1146584-Pelagomonas_calceolata.AAC.2
MLVRIQQLLEALGSSTWLEKCFVFNGTSGGSKSRSIVHRVGASLGARHCKAGGGESPQAHG